MKTITPTEDCQVCYWSRAIWNGTVKWFCEIECEPVNGECDKFEREPGADG